MIKRLWYRIPAPHRYILDRSFSSTFICCKISIWHCKNFSGRRRATDVSHLQVVLLELLARQTTQRARTVHLRHGDAGPAVQHVSHRLLCPQRVGGGHRALQVTVMNRFRHKGQSDYTEPSPCQLGGLHHRVFELYQKNCVHSLWL